MCDAFACEGRFVGIGVVNEQIRVWSAFSSSTLSATKSRDLFKKFLLDPTALHRPHSTPDVPSPEGSKSSSIFYSSIYLWHLHMLKLFSISHLVMHFMIFIPDSSRDALEICFSCNRMDQIWRNSFSQKRKKKKKTFVFDVPHECQRGRKDAEDKFWLDSSISLYD